MILCVAFCRRSNHPHHSDWWGNFSVEETVKEFPWLAPLVENIHNEDGTHLPYTTHYSALLFIDYGADETIISLSFKYDGKNVRAAKIALKEGCLPSMAELASRINQQAKRRRR